VIAYLLFPSFLLATLIELIFEMRLSKHNSEKLLQQGAVEYAAGTLPFMAGLYVLMYVGAIAEFFFLKRPIPVSWFAGFLLLYVAAKALKFWAVHTLGRYWTMKVLIVPGTKTVDSGPYRWVRHPNYVAVLMEIAGTTLPGKALWTCLGVLVLFSFVLYHRIRLEEEALTRQTDYSGAMGKKRRFVP
jgi:methyltransferase